MTDLAPTETFETHLSQWNRGAVGERPKMMLVIAIMVGLVPILWSQGTGSEIMQRIAVPMIGGMVTSTVLTLVVIPVIYALVKSRGLSQHQLCDSRGGHVVMITSGSAGLEAFTRADTGCDHDRALINLGPVGRCY